MDEPLVTPHRGESAILTANDETPTIARQTRSLEKRRTELFRDMGGLAPQITVDFFLENILPPLPKELDVDEVVTALKERGHITHLNRWDGFAIDPADSIEHEGKTFAPLEVMANAIAEVAASLTGVDSVLEFQNNPHLGPSWVDSRSRPDGYFVLRDRRSGIRWADIGVSCEYHKWVEMDTERDNVQKVIWSMEHCMRDDPRRRFTFGLTIEDTQMKLWFCSRAGLLVSEPFNFIEEHATVTCIFLSFLYAEQHDMGWDPTMTYVKDREGRIQYHSDGTPRYDITVRTPQTEEVIYRTTKVLSDAGADVPLGKGTRVWEAKKVVDDEECGEPVALKDSWVNNDRDREGDLFASLRDSAPSELIRESIDTRFLTVLHHGDVYIHGEADETRIVMPRGVDIPKECPRYDLFVPISMDERPPIGHYLTPEEYKARIHRTPPTYHSRAHYRIVFKEICQPLHKITSLALVLKVLSHIVHALQLMHNSGWVHRDISVGNILVDKDGNGRLGDLEYAQKMGQPSSPECCMGTAGFIAAEVSLQDYLSIREPTNHASSSSDEDETDTSSAGNGDKNNIRSILTAPRKRRVRKIDANEWPHWEFRYNPLHDLESVWWVAVYFLFKRKMVRDSGEDPVYKEQLEVQRRYANKLFYDKTERFRVMTCANIFSDKLHCLNSLAWKFGQVLENLRQRLARCYCEAEQLEHLAAIDHTVADRLHESFSRTFLGLTKYLCVEVGPLRPEPRQNRRVETKAEPEAQSSERKRQREEEKEEEESSDIEESMSQGSRDGSSGAAPLKPLVGSKKRRCD
ncbi:hypothetical protein AcV5_002972 [Taiwanofungus camphoratus]|nr:hypothetical protein AcV5_002972 [Antrodia cinnamomea]